MGKRSRDGDGEKKKKKKREREKRRNDITEENGLPTVSIALPGSIIDNAQSLELATRLAGQIARAATIFRIDEIVVIDSKNSSFDGGCPMTPESSYEHESGSSFLVKILQYLETPQYLRKSLFPIQSCLKFVGMLPPLDAPHHLRKHEWAPYREGITLDESPPNSSGTLVDIGLNKNVTIDQTVRPGRRVTVSMGPGRDMSPGVKHSIVSVSMPREEAGIYWGYRVRHAAGLSSVFLDCPHKGGYDCSIGTSEHGVAITASELNLPTFRHLLIAFGGLAGLEECVNSDDSLKGKNVHEVFDFYLNTCPSPGSRTIRTEEALFTCLQYFQDPISRASAKFL